jgi:drug/metabolite transporter (DMT)-like permease
MIGLPRGGARLSRGYGIALTSAAILSTTAIFIRSITLTYALPPLILAFWRDVFVVVTLVPALAIIRSSLLRVRSAHLPFLMLYGLALAVFNALWTLSVALNGAAAATVLVYCSGGFTALLGRWILKERLDWVKASVVVLCFAGCVLVSGAANTADWRANPVGIIAGILSGLLYAVYSLMGRSASTRGLNPWTTLLYTFGFAAVFLLLVNLPPGGFLPGTAARPADFFRLGGSLPGWGLLFLLAAGPTVAGFGLYNVSLSRLPSSVVNLIATMEPAFTAVIAYLLLGELLSAQQLGGGLLIIAGVVFLRVHQGRLPGKPADADKRIGTVSGGP